MRVQSANAKNKSSQRKRHAANITLGLHIENILHTL